jgi:hypothetical protein
VKKCRGSKSSTQSSPKTSHKSKPSSIGETLSSGRDAATGSLSINNQDSRDLHHIQSSSSSLLTTTNGQEFASGSPSVASSVSNASSEDALVNHNTSNNIVVDAESQEGFMPFQDNVGIESSTSSSIINDSKVFNNENDVEDRIIVNKQDCDSQDSSKDNLCSNLPSQPGNCVPPSIASTCSNPDCASTAHYISSSLQPSVLKSHLQAAYSAFAFLHHSFNKVLEEQGLVKLRNILKDFYDKVSFMFFLLMFNHVILQLCY